MIYLYNKTKYSDEVLQSVLETAYKQIKVQGKELEGDVAVKVMYTAHSSRFVGRMYPHIPILESIVGQVKKYGKGYPVESPIKDTNKTYNSATRDGSVGWIIVRVPKLSPNNDLSVAKRVYNTILHELLHVWQYRNQELALKDWNRPGCTWRMFWDAYVSPNSSRQLSYMRQPLEIHVRQKIKETPQTKNRTQAENTLNRIFSDDKSKVRKQTVKYNKYGQRMSDYRNVKMNRLRSGDEVVRCPHCGEKSIVLEQHLNDKYKTYTHIAAVDDELVNHGYTASESRYTQYGCVERINGSEVVKWGHTKIDGDDHLKSFSSNPHSRRW